MARVKYVKERTGEEITGWSQLLHRRQRREERRRLKELERQKELERRREAGEIAQVNSVPADTRADISTSTTASATTGATTRPATRATTRATTTPTTRRVTRAAARAATNVATSDTTTAANIDTITAPVSAPASAPATATPAALPTVIAMAVEDEEHGDMGLLDSALFEPVNDENAPQLVSVPTVAKGNEKTVEPVTRWRSECISQVADVAISNVQADMPSTSTNATPLAFAPATAPATVSPFAIDVEEHSAVDRSEPGNDETVHQQVAMPSAAQEHQEIVKPTTGARVEAALQLVPVVDIINRLFAESLHRLQAPTPEMVAAEARVFLARAHENETVQAVRKAAMTLNLEVLHRINESSGRLDLMTEILKFRLQQVFLDELVK